MLNALYSLLCGVSLGWLAGLSMSPVASSILGALMTILIGVIGAVAGLKSLELQASDKDDKQPKKYERLATRVNLAPVAFLTLGMALGCPAGVAIRARGWLGPQPANPQSTGSENPALASEGRPSKGEGSRQSDIHSKHDQPMVGWFASGSASDCQRLTTAPDEELKVTFARIEDPRGKAFAEGCSTTACLEAAVSVLCGKKTSDEWPVFK